MRLELETGNLNKGASVSLRHLNSKISHLDAYVYVCEGAVGGKKKRSQVLVRDFSCPFFSALSRPTLWNLADIVYNLSSSQNSTKC